jgi:lysophospholipase L1-like esterase
MTDDLLRTLDSLTDPARIDVTRRIYPTNYWFLLLSLSCLLGGCQLPMYQATAPSATYLETIKIEFGKKWPQNRTVNVVFHGHSVPTGYFATPVVRSLDAYPHLLLHHIKKDYPRAVVNVITTSIGGEQAEQGAKRFRREVLNHRPDVVFIDYALNDRSIGLQRAKKAWEKMIIAARRAGIPVVLMTPSPDKKVDLTDPESILEQHSRQIRQLAADHGLGLVDSYAAFQRAVRAGATVDELMATGNHPNERGHLLIMDELMKYFW